MVSMNISLPDKMKKRVQQQVAQGTYANASEYLRDLIRQDMNRQNALIVELKKGEASGVSKRRIPEIAAAARRSKTGKHA